MPPRDKPLMRLVPEPAAAAGDGGTDDDGDEFEIVTHWSDDELLLFRTFRGYLKNISTDITGELTIRLGIVPQDKPHAFALTDFTGMVFTFDAYFKPRRARTGTEDESVPEADPPDGNSDEDG